MSTSTLDPRVARRRAIEALRSGVPSREAVAALGSAQSEIEDRFGAILASLRALPSGGHHPGGMLVGGSFGSGKSHLLEHLAHLAMNDGFVVSKVTISKETPLYDPAKDEWIPLGSADPPAWRQYQSADWVGDSARQCGCTGA